MFNKPLADLLLKSDVVVGRSDVALSSIVIDSRHVSKGALFAALKGEKVDGRNFILQAEQSGATAVLCGVDDVIPATQMTVIRAVEPRRSLAHIASQFYGRQPAHMVAITGTDGKTSTADFYRQFLHLLGNQSASIGTLGVYGGTGKKIIEGTHTTPDAVSLHKILAELADKNITHVALEASSHGLHQYRLHGVNLEAAAFTNIARDHLDYHKTDDAYFAAKSMLFSEVLPAGKTAILNADDKRFPELKQICASRGQQVIDFGFHAGSLHIVSLTPHVSGQVMVCDVLGERYTIDISLVGAFQAMNILAAMGLALAGGETADALVAVIAKLQGVAGRMQHVATLNNGAAIYVDYAHTPMALANILTTIRAHTVGRLHVVFGCGGDRDAGKRPEMGRIANELADVITVTDDNPRSEEPTLIRKAILAACPNGKDVADRKDAIYAAVAALMSGDVLVIAGKGHEKVQIVAGVEYPFDDVMVARAAAGE
jgi:UDP-N-acetylmuramoyl-L-alanyl-D-glutamate--2,6-diaminopimelate ligase